MLNKLHVLPFKQVSYHSQRKKVAQKWCTLCMIYIQSPHNPFFLIKVELSSHSRSADVDARSQKRNLIQSTQGWPDQRKGFDSVFQK